MRPRPGPSQPRTGLVGQHRPPSSSHSSTYFVLLRSRYLALQTPRPTPIKCPRAKFHDGAQNPPWGSVHISRLPSSSHPPVQSSALLSSHHHSNQSEPTKNKAQSRIQKISDNACYIYNVTHKSSSLVVTSIISSRRIIRCRPFSPLQLKCHGASHQGDSRTPNECSHKRHRRPQPKSMKEKGKKKGQPINHQSI
ncbi:uncharacterized protein BO96DRAFT_142112 [Aspergillus niger CBS 101883]|uniref:uncharacterized protein n=1 Tax=Aspergillus lacticoffeatus (strain CBS 101883) TaxID=1450533 RepID=UPI000D7FA117|nr:uncharacterized protein BO96DRAFT_142112 [Aspergillus niger CBS 101883]PYH60533.1 hypothetical protein BO96DRAFT_142112 [Aspergillus niger CBS 101883]